MDKICRDFGNFLRAKRKAKGLTQEEAAKAIGVVQSNYARYESGERECSISTMYALGELLDFKPGEFFDNYEY